MTTEQAPDARALMEEIVKLLVDDPAAVRIEAVPEGDEIVLELEVAESDMGKVIGKQGRTARSLRTLLAAASMKLERRYTLEILE